MLGQSLICQIIHLLLFSVTVIVSARGNQLYWWENLVATVIKSINKEFWIPQETALHFDNSKNKYINECCLFLSTCPDFRNYAKVPTDSQMLSTTTLSKTKAGYNLL